MREIERLVLFLCNRLQPLMNIIRDPRHSVRAIEPHTDWLRAHVKRRSSHQYVLFRLHSTDHRPYAKGSRWTGRDGAERCAGYTLSVGKVQCVAETAIGRRNRDPLPSRHPSQTYKRAVRQWPSPLQLFSAPGLLDEFRITSTQVQKVRLLENKLAGVHPIALREQFVGLDQWLRTDALQHFPVTVRFSTGNVDGIRSEVLDLKVVVLPRRQMRRTRVQAS